MDAVIYALTEPRENDDRMLTERIRQCREYAKANGFQVVRIFQDRRRSGANLDRPGFTQLCDYLIKHGPQALIITTLRQLTRRRNDGELIADVFDDLDVQVYAVDEGRISPGRIANPQKLSDIEDEIDGEEIDEDDAPGPTPVRPRFKSRQHPPSSSWIGMN